MWDIPKRIVYHSYHHFWSQMDATAPLQKSPAEEIEPDRNSHQKSDLPEGVLPICSSCKRIRDPQGTWHTVETYIHSALGVNLSHSICPKCAPQMYPWFKE